MISSQSSRSGIRSRKHQPIRSRYLEALANERRAVRRGADHISIRFYSRLNVLFLPAWRQVGSQQYHPFLNITTRNMKILRNTGRQPGLSCACGIQTIPGMLYIFNALCSNHFLPKYLSFRRSLSLLTLLSFNVYVPYPLKEIKVTGPVSDLPPPPSPVLVWAEVSNKK